MPEKELNRRRDGRRLDDGGCTCAGRQRLVSAAAYLGVFEVYGGAIIGDTIVSGTKVPIKMGNVLPLSAISSSTSRKPYALEEACTVWEWVLIDKN
ncbi:hypothetical protein R6Q57_026456 [Mikania cordata]